MTVKAKIITWTSVIAVVALAAFIFFRFFFVYSSGVNTGDINYFQKQGVVFKTYEGKMIQTGFRSAGGGVNGLKSNEFKFSVTNDSVAAKLMRCSGKEVELHWKRYFGTLPWRGSSQYIVDEILSIKEHE
ncbi:MAG: hypothetical protein K5867_10585 [Bacteroidales bacterium]|nr:hypothetical protein [Bacteroidales bacterium]